jgi:2'-5' RNA ligase
MRLFLAIDPPPAVKKEIHNQISSLRKKHPDFRWVDFINYHITLHFFGEVFNEDEISKRLKDILYDAESFYLYSLNLDVFVKKQLLLYLDFKREKKLEQIVTTIRVDSGIGDMKFVPHLTLSRSSLSSKQQYFALKNEIEKMSIDVNFKVDTLYLMESILTEKQPIYNIISEFKLLDET